MKIKKITHTIAFASIAFIIFAYYSGMFNFEIFINGDAIYPYSLIHSIISDKVHLLSWFPSPSPYVFPDLVFYLVSYLISFGELKESVVVYAAIQLLVYYYIIFYSLKNLKVKNYDYISAISMLVLVSLAIKYWIYAYSLIPVFHFGSYMSCLFGLMLYKKFTENSSVITLTYISLICVLVSYSDNTFVIWFSLPLTVISILLYIKEKKKEFIIAGALVLVTSMVGKISSTYLFFNSQMYSYKPDFSHLLIGMKDNLDILSSTPYGKISIALTMFCFLISIWHYFRRKETNWTTVYFSMCGLSFFSMFILTSAQSDMPVGERYYMPLFFGSIILGLIVIFNNSKIILTSTILVVVFSLDIFMSAKDNYHRYDFISKDELCVKESIEKNGLKSGIASYWAEKRLTAFFGYNIAQVNSNLDEMRWITSNEFFNGDYQFAIEKHDDPSSINLLKLKELNGLPDTTYSCGNYTVHIYKRGIKLQGYGNFTRIGKKQVYRPGVLLPSNNAKIEDGLIVTNSNFKGGNVSFGPYIELAKGEYSITFDIKNMSTESVDIGVDVTADGSEKTIFSQYYSGNSHLIKIIGHFNLVKDEKMIEFRAFEESASPVAIEKISIERVN